jgi:hypothetical protein
MLIMWKHIRYNWNCLPNVPKQNRPHGFRLSPNSDRPHYKSHHSLGLISCFQSRHRQNLFCFPHTAQTTQSSNQAWRTLSISGLRIQPAVLKRRNMSMTSDDNSSCHGNSSDEKTLGNCYLPTISTEVKDRLLLFAAGTDCYDVSTPI